MENIKNPETDSHPQPQKGSRAESGAVECGKNKVYHNGYSYLKRMKFVLKFLEKKS